MKNHLSFTSQDKPRQKKICLASTVRPIPAPFYLRSQQEMEPESQIADGDRK